MFYLQCNKCGFYNEAKTEYLVFCSGCNKKMDNNFSEWRKKNPDESFDEFKQQVCVSEDEVRKNMPEPKSKMPHGIKYWIGFTIVFAIFYALGNYGGDSVVRYFRSEKTDEGILDQKWVRETYGDYGLSVETPVKLTKGDLPVPENIKQFISKMEVYNYMSEKGFRILINSIEYKPEIGSTSLEGAANGSVNEVKSQKGVTDFVYTEEAAVKSDIPGFIQKGTYKQSGIELEFINSGFATQFHIWQVLVMFESNDEIGRQAAERVIESVEIRNTNN